MAITEQHSIGPLKIVVCIKQVPLLSALRFDPETRRLVREGVPLEINELDVYALSEAIRLRTHYGGEVIAITMGPPQAHEALATALAMGADRAIHLSDRAFGGADTMATARTLAATIAGMQADLIFCGRHSIDAETSQVGPEIAEMLGIPQISAIQKIDIQLNNGKHEVLATRETDEGSETLIVPLPALVTAAEKLNEGIWPDEQAIKEAGSWADRYQVVTAVDLNIDANLLGQKGSPTRVAEVEEDTHARAGQMITGDNPEQLVEELVMILEERGLLDLVDDHGAVIQGEHPHHEPGRPHHEPEHPHHEPGRLQHELGRPQGSPLQASLHGAVPLRQGDAQPGKAVWVIAELAPHGIRRITLELLGKGNELAAQLQGELAAVLIGGPDIGQHAATLAAYGTERVFVASDPALEQYTTEGYTAIVMEAIRQYQPAVVLLGSTADGRDLAPRVAARLNLGLTGDCIDLDIDEQQRLVQYKPAFGNQIISSILSNTLPAMATLRPGMLHAAVPDFSREPVIETLSTTGIAGQIRSRIIKHEHRNTGVEALEAAHTIIGVGMGVGEPERYATTIHRLAALLDAAIGATRNVTDQGWLPKQVQIGLTGRAVAPAFYIALGIRGAAEHIAGIRKAGFVVSINKNRRAAIFRHSDVGVVGDVHMLVPLLIERLEKRIR